MGRYRTINVDLNRQYRNDLNQNFTDIEKDISKSGLDIARVEAESKERDNLIAGTNVEAIIERINSSADNAVIQAQHAKTQGDCAKTQGEFAKFQGDYAQVKGDYADEKAILADKAAASANLEASNLSQLKIDVTTATQNANVATDNANAQATFAQEQANRAKIEADRIEGMDVGELATNIGDLATLQTENKTNLVSAINEVESQATNHESRLNQLENGSVSVKADVSGLNREVAYLKLKQDSNERIEGGTVFADDMNGNRFGFTLDEINSRGFKIKNGKLVLLEDVDVPHNVTDSTVVASAYSTAGNGGRKIVMLDTGLLIIACRQTTSGYPIYLYKSSDYGQTWSLFHPTNTSPNSGISSDFSLATNGINVYLILNFVSSSISFVSFDSSGNKVINNKVIDQTQTAIGNISLTVDPTNGHLHAAWSSKNSTYPNSFNIRYSKSTDGGATWSAVEQVTNFNVTAAYCTNPSIVVNANGLPCVVYEVQSASTSYRIRRALKKIDGSWIFVDIYEGGTYIQYSPSAVVDKDGVIPVVGHSKDAIDTTIDYIRFSKSPDDGVSWSAMKKLVQGKNGTLTVDNNNKYIIIYEDAGNIKRIESTDKGENWSTPTVLGAGTNPSTMYDKSYSLGFTTPPTLYMTASSVKFTGNWNGKSEVQTTAATVIYDIPSTDYVGAYVKTQGNVTVTATINDAPMKSELDNNEYEFTGSLDTVAPIKLKLNVSRPNTINGENDALTRILGGRS